MTAIRGRSLPPSPANAYAHIEVQPAEATGADMADIGRETLYVGRYRLDPLAEFEGPRMPPASMFTMYLNRKS